MSWIQPYATLLDGLLEAACLVDKTSFRVLAVNHAALQLMGATRSSVIGCLATELACTPEDLVFWSDAQAMQVSKGEDEQPSIHSQILIFRPDGSRRSVDRQVKLLNLPDGESVFLCSMNDQTERLQIEEKLEHQLAEARATLESTADAILVTDVTGVIQGFNRIFSHIWRIPTSLLSPGNDAAIYTFMREQVEHLEAYDHSHLQIQGDPMLEGHEIISLKGGKTLERVTLPQLVRGVPVGRVFSYRDITERLRSEQQMRLAAKAYESSLDAIFVVDAGYRIISINDACRQLMKDRSQLLSGTKLTDILGYQQPSDREELSVLLDRMHITPRWEGVLHYNKVDGGVTALSVSLAYVASRHGGAAYIVGHAHDLTEMLAAKQRIQDLAYRDALTGLPNRIVLAERFEQTIAFAQRNGGGFATMFIDLDRFKYINDTLGHGFGDMVLIQVAERIKKCLRPYDTMARLGGDEFVVILHDAAVRTTETVGQRILEVLAQPFERDEISFNVTCSIGVAMYPIDGMSMTELVKNADDAMYLVKQHGRAAMRFYQRKMNVDRLTPMALDHAMRLALEQGAYRLNYQPQVDITSGEIVGAEALIRWRDAELGDMAPGRFIPIAEETGFIVKLGDWVLTEAVQQAAAWLASGLRVPVSVNISASQFQQRGFVEKVASVLQKYELPAELIELELTESILIDDGDEVLVRLRELADLGIRLAIDDFGTGYSSLAYLKRFPIQRLKIDRSFIRLLPDDESDAAITTAVIHMGHLLKLQVIAEGVETEAQREFLAQAGCDEYQGFLCSPALSATEFERLMALGDHLGHLDTRGDSVPEL